MSMRLVVGNYVITPFVQSVKWAGGMDQVARTLTAELADAWPEVGERAAYWWDGKKLFEGQVQYVDVSRDGARMEATDDGVYLANNYCYKEYKGTPQAIARQVCAEFDVPVGTLAARSDTTKVTSTGDLTAFEVIRRAYEGADKKPRRQYLMTISGGKLYVEQVGTDMAAAIRWEIESSSRSESIKNMVNRVVILDKDGKRKTGEVQNADDRAKYGTFGKTYKAQKGKNSTSEAQKLLQGKEITGKLTGEGIITCVSGKAVRVVDPDTGLSGKQTIKSDTHTFSPAGHEMTLEFYYG